MSNKEKCIELLLATSESDHLTYMSPSQFLSFTKTRHKFKVSN